MARQARRVEVVGRHRAAAHLGERPCECVDQPARRRAEHVVRGVGGLVHRDQVAPNVLRQRAHQQAGELVPVAGDQPIEPLGGQLVERRSGHRDGGPVERGVGVVAVRDRVLGVTGLPSRWPPRVRVVGEHDPAPAREHRRVEIEQARLVTLRVAPPSVEVPRRRGVWWHALVVELVERLVVEQVASPNARLEQPHPRDELGVARDEVVPRLPVAGNQRVADEHLARQLGVDPLDADGAVRHDRQAVQRDRLRRDGTPRPGVPARLTVRPLHQVRGQTFGPLGLHGGDPPRRTAATSPPARPPSPSGAACA